MNCEASVNANCSQSDFSMSLHVKSGNCVVVASEGEFSKKKGSAFSFLFSTDRPPYCDKAEEDRLVVDFRKRSVLLAVLGV